MTVKIKIFDGNQCATMNQSDDEIIFETAENKVHHSVYIIIPYILSGNVKFSIFEEIDFFNEKKYFPVILNYSSQGKLSYDKSTGIFTAIGESDFKIQINSSFINRIKIKYLNESINKTEKIQCAYQGNR